MRDFVYYHPTSLDEARNLAMQQGAMLLAGGQTLLRDMKLGRHSPTSLIDVTGIVPKQIEFLDGAVWIGAGATHAEVASSPVLQQHLPVLTALVEHIGDPAVRHRGTLGGALAARDLIELLCCSRQYTERASTQDSRTPPITFEP